MCVTDTKPRPDAQPPMERPSFELLKQQWADAIRAYFANSTEETAAEVKRTHDAVAAEAARLDAERAEREQDGQ